MKNGIHTDRLFKARRKELRNTATPHEVKLWKYLKGKNLGYKFQRQHSIGSYIVDFYCPCKRLIIEVDGSQHEENKEYDVQRTKFFEAQGYRVLRFWNNEISTQIFSVLEKIQEYLTT
jgi:very-short-patch-repair endonuclease